MCGHAAASKVVCVFLHSTTGFLAGGFFIGGNPREDLEICLVVTSSKYELELTPAVYLLPKHGCTVSGFNVIADAAGKMFLIFGFTL